MTHSHAALIVVDLQALTLPNSGTRPVDDLLADVSRLLAHFRASGQLVVHAVSTGMPAGETQHGGGPRLWTDEQTEIAQAVRPLDDEPVVRRAAWSAFAGTRLDKLLKAGEASTLVIVGLATPFGIESTARDAYDLGYSVVVPADGVSGPDPAAHEWTLARVIPALGRVTTVDGFLAG